jgi:Helix-turn-helix domain
MTVTSISLARQARRKPSHSPEQKSFTSWKLDIQKCLIADPRLSAVAKLVAICILHHVNQESRKTWLSIETISDETCVGWRHVARAIKTLQQTGWIVVRRGNRQRANEYRFSEANMNNMLDRLTILRDRREVARKRKRAISEMTPESSQKCSDMTRESCPEMTPESSLHLRGTP